ncbi:cAMP-binding protein [Planomonospora sphaerica]|uniref:cAMP-binding protein n=2 Tax=Planomonospora sphaerica TaxID=161355 RepID=A0A171DDR5_9ACTN|nr:cAMP-binding protein [Planomonospora sphaerica]
MTAPCARVADMFAITVRTEDGRRHVRVDAGGLAGLIGRLGGRNDRFLVVQRIPDLPEVFVQVWHENGGDYVLEHRDGAPDRHFQTVLDDPGPVIAAITRWARPEEDWDSGLDWTSLDLGPSEPPPPLELDQDERERLDARVREVIVGGYATRAQLAELAQEYLVSDDRHPVSPEQARLLADRMWLERVEEQASWQGETDPERLSRAFAALEASGITAREHFACCRSCGQAEIWSAGAPDARGYVYFHSQCTDSAARGHGLALLYGGFDGSSDTTASIGREVVAALEKTGLPVEWNGDPSQSITVTPLDWRKRLIG